MNVLRHPVLQRVVAILLLAGGSVACVPAAEAATVHESDLRRALGDSNAVDLALDAAREAVTPHGAARAFVEAYRLATGETLADVDRLLFDTPDRFGAPDGPAQEAVWQIAQASSVTLDRTLASTGTLRGVSAPSHSVELAASDVALVLPAHPRRAAQRTRAP